MWRLYSRDRVVTATSLRPMRLHDASRPHRSWAGFTPASHQLHTSFTPVLCQLYFLHQVRSPARRPRYPHTSRLHEHAHGDIGTSRRGHGKATARPRQGYISDMVLINARSFTRTANRLAAASCRASSHSKPTHTRARGARYPRHPHLPHPLPTQPPPPPPRGWRRAVWRGDPGHGADSGGRGKAGGRAGRTGRAAGEPARAFIRRAEC